MFGAVRRMATGGIRILTSDDPSYFTSVCPRSGRTRFRADVRSIIGAALAAAFIAAGLASMADFSPASTGEVAAIAATAGAIAGKFLLA